MATYVWTGATSTAFGTASNWLKDDGTNEVPVDGSTIVFDGRAQNHCAGSDQSSIEPALVRITSQFTRLIGTFSSGVVTFLKLGPAALLIGEPDADGQFGPGSAGIAIDLTTDPNATRVISTANIGTSGFPPVLLRGAHSSNSLQVLSGWVGYGVYAGDTCTLPLVSLLGPAANVELGGGCALATIHQLAGRVLFRSAVTTLNQEGGAARAEGTGAITLADVGGELVANSTGTITTLNVFGTGHARFDQSNAARTVTNATLFGGGQITLPEPYSSLTLTNGIILSRGATIDQVHGGRDVKIALSAP